MPVRLYQYQKTSIYVIELQVDVRQTPDIAELRRLKKEEIEMKGVSNLVIDCTSKDVKVSSGSMEPIIGLCKREHQRLVFSRPSTQLERMLETYQLKRQFEVYNSVEEAIRSFTLQ